MEKVIPVWINGCNIILLTSIGADLWKITFRKIPSSFQCPNLNTKFFFTTSDSAVLLKILMQSDYLLEILLNI